MIRICQKCGDYYADALLAFCLVDGTPLVSVEPMSQRWREGARVIEAKENALRKQKRKLKWRRILLSATTMAIAALVVYVVAANALIYLKPEQEEVVVVKPLTEPTEPGEPVSTPTPQSTVTPKPTASPVVKETPTPTPTPKITITVTPTPTTDKPLECAITDQSREHKSIIDKFGKAWRSKIMAENVPADFPKAIELLGVAKPKPTLGEITYESSFSKGCKAFVTARFAWQVGINLNGTIKGVSIKGQRKFACVKTKETWRCS